MASADQLSQSLQGFGRLSLSQKFGILVVVALSIALLVGAWSWSKSLDYSVLFSNLSASDGGDVIGALQQMNVPYKVSEGGTVILVPASKVDATRLKLASQGLPKGGLVGFEVMENEKLGTSQFVEHVNYQRALQGELARSIQSLSEVNAARVHLAIPKQTAFLRAQQKPTASVLVELRPGRTLGPNQIAGIVHLVASAVPDLTTGNVAVVDQNGNLLSQVKNSLDDNGLDPAQLKYEHQVEASYVQRIEDILEPIVGQGNVRAQVAADINFSQMEQTAETYKPNPPADQAIRSEQTQESSSTTPGATGVPGALTNQPPVPATAPLTRGGTAANNTANRTGKAAPVNGSRDSTINYELDKTIKHIKDAAGTIKRLSVAVVINDKQSVGRGGQPVSTPLSAAEMKQMTDLVREAMGFSAKRGDTLNVANVAFSAPGKKEVIPATPWYQSPELLAMGQESLKYLIIAIIAFFLWTRLLRPLFEKLLEAAPPPVEEALALSPEGLGESRQSQMQHMAYDAKLANARGMARTEPKVVANVIKDWVGGNQ